MSNRIYKLLLVCIIALTIVSLTLIIFYYVLQLAVV